MPMNLAHPQQSGRGLHVVHVVLGLDVGGLERNVVNQVREGRKLGQRVSILCLDSPGELAPRAAEHGATITALHRKGGLRPALVGRIRKILRAWQPDVVHTHQLITLLYAGRAARSLRVPVILHTEHGREKYDSRLRTRLLGRIAARCCDRFYCLTGEMAQRVRGARIVSEQKLQIIQNGIDLDSFADADHDGTWARKQAGIPENAVVVGTVGRLNEVKRQDVLIRGFAEAQKRSAETHAADLHLLLVGDGPSRAQLQSLATELGVEKSVHFAGYQPHSGPFLKAMNIFALTSRSEGMPQAILEAGFMGLPVIGSRVGGIPEAVAEGQTGLLFEVGDHAQLARCIHALLADPKKARAMGEAGRRNVAAKFSVARMAADYHQAALEILGTPPEADGSSPTVSAAPERPRAHVQLALEEVR